MPDAWTTSVYEPDIAAKADTIFKKPATHRPEREEAPPAFAGGFFVWWLRGQDLNL